MAKRAEADVFALLVELVAVLDDNPDDLGVVVQPPGHGDDVKPDAWTAEVCDMAGMHHVAGAIARAPTTRRSANRCARRRNALPTP